MQYVSIDDGLNVTDVQDDAAICEKVLYTIQSEEVELDEENSC